MEGCAIPLPKVEENKELCSLFKIKTENHTFSVLVNNFTSDLGHNQNQSLTAPLLPLGYGNYPLCQLVPAISCQLGTFHQTAHADGAPAGKMRVGLVSKSSNDGGLEACPQKDFKGPLGRQKMPFKVLGTIILCRKIRRSSL